MSYKSANKADLSFYYWARPKILDSTASLGGLSWVSTQRQNALKPFPSDYKLPLGEQAEFLVIPQGCERYIVLIVLVTMTHRFNDTLTQFI